MEAFVILGGFCALFLLVALRARILAAIRRIGHTRLILVVAVLVFIYSTANPPWRIVVKDNKGHTKRTELVWSYLGESPRVDHEPYQAAHIAVDVFCLQTLCLLASTVAGFYLATARPRLPMARGGLTT